MSRTKAAGDYITKDFIQACLPRQLLKKGYRRALVLTDMNVMYLSIAIFQDNINPYPAQALEP